MNNHKGSIKNPGAQSFEETMGISQKNVNPAASPQALIPKSSIIPEFSACQSNPGADILKEFTIKHSNFTGEDVESYKQKLNNDSNEVTKWQRAYDDSRRAKENSSIIQNNLNNLNQAKKKLADTKKTYEYVLNEYTKQAQNTYAVATSAASISPYYHDGVDYSKLSIQEYDDLISKFKADLASLENDYNISKQAGLNSKSLEEKEFGIKGIKGYIDRALKYKKQFYPESMPQTIASKSNDTGTKTQTTSAESKKNIFKVAMVCGIGLLAILGIVLFPSSSK